MIRNILAASTAMTLALGSIALAQTAPAAPAQPAANNPTTTPATAPATNTQNPLKKKQAGATGTANNAPFGENENENGMDDEHGEGAGGGEGGEGGGDHD